MKKRIIVLIISILAITATTCMTGLFSDISNITLKRLVYVLLNVLNGGIALIAIKLTGIKIDIDFKNKKQYLIGIGIAIIMSLCLAVIPVLFGTSLVGKHTDFSWSSLLFNLFFYMIIIGPVEELIFRVYLQETFIGFFYKNKWMGVIIASFIFGLWHLINGSFIQGLFTFGIGLVFGFSKYLIKNCTYLSVAVGHGLYDFLNVIVRMFIL